MKIVFPQYFAEFHCLADGCPDTCCAGWEVVLDEEAADRYEQLGEEHSRLRERIRQATGKDGGDLIFRAEPDGRCPFLDGSGLCDIQKELGEEGLCRTCHLYPRFIGEYGGVREIGLSLSCPEAARIVLTHKGKVAFLTEDDSSVPPSLNDLDAERYFAVRQLRETALSLAQAAPLPVDERCALLLRLAKKGQKKLHKEKYGEMEGVAGRFDPHRMMGELQSCCRKCAGVEPMAYKLLPETLISLSILRPEWKVRLEMKVRELEMEPLVRIRPLDAEFETQFLTAFLYRYLLRSAYGGSALGYMKLCIGSLLSVRFLGQGCGQEELLTLARLYSREVEHDEENVARLLDIFETDKRFSVKGMTALLLQDYPQPMGR